MKSQVEIIALADVKFEEAKCLFDNNFFDGAYYIAGYTIELLLKAKVCKTLGIADFFLFDTKKAKLETYKPFKAHDYSQLLVLSGIYTELDNELNNNIIFKGHWSIVSSWSEGSRYLTGKTQDEVKTFLNSINEVRTWIKKHL